MGFVYPDAAITWEDFERKFREGMGREMTPQERTWFRLSSIALDATDDEPHDRGVGASAPGRFRF